jgi:hypothetical protein
VQDNRELRDTLLYERRGRTLQNLERVPIDLFGFFHIHVVAKCLLQKRQPAGIWKTTFLPGEKNPNRTDMNHHQSLQRKVIGKLLNIDGGHPQDLTVSMMSRLRHWGIFDLVRAQACRQPDQREPRTPLVWDRILEPSPGRRERPYPYYRSE